MQNLKLNRKDMEYLKEKYESSFKENGFSPKSVLWTEEKQKIRFEALISEFNLENKSILEFGCGFGDINKILKDRYKNYEYLGVDLVEDFIKTGRKNYGSTKIKYECGDFLSKNFNKKFDYIIESGIFNLKLKMMDNYDFIQQSINKAFELFNEAIAFNFVTERVNFKDDGSYYINPEKVLEIAYRYSKKIILKNNYMPFDYTMIIYKDDSYDENAVFNAYKN
ncbi:SAM-dependent methyltransferase [Clostridium algifaecis]|uniref:SAM-dependent methyltransferase n=1 Tax=Clostridium algifaecis TaxID=1472040 RepID=A0ABS4KUV8_9CLOT|nr:class I SAM-dependent methyltransferase [Clostridium algifaecis]MBP2033802.1 SAM-dependent methyltransferase [Clostridium algifaecis]